jgi:hypothetical protein
MPVRTARDNGFAVRSPAGAKPEPGVPLGTGARMAVTARSSNTSGLADERGAS